MRVRAGINLPVTKDGWLPDGSRLTYLDEPARHRVADRLPLRVAEHNVVLPGSDGGEVSETYTIATTLLDHQAADAEALRAAYPMRWSASETTIGENKTTVTGPARPPPRACAPANRNSPTRNYGPGWPPPSWSAPAPPPRLRPVPRPPSPPAASASPPGTDQVSFTTMRRAAAASMRQSLVTATTSLAALAALAEAAGQTALHTLNRTGRQRYSERKQKSRPAFGHTRATKTTHRGPVKITRFQPTASVT